ncbi:hypothetical protein QUB68_15620 [Microcoleus sp. A006_D1]
MTNIGDAPYRDNLAEVTSAEEKVRIIYEGFTEVEVKLKRSPDCQ